MGWPYGARKSGFPEIWISGNPDIRKSGYPDIRISGFPEIRISGNPDIRISGYPDIRKSGYQEIRISGFPDFLISGYPDFWTSGNLKTEATSLKTYRPLFKNFPIAYKTETPILWHNHAPAIHTKHIDNSRSIESLPR